MKKDLVVIKCPVCGQEYLPAEIYMPNSFFGKQTDIIRKRSGEIDYYLGEDMDLDEEFMCEACFAKLKIHANLSFTVDANKKEDLDDEYTTMIHKPSKIKLEEENLF